MLNTFDQLIKVVNIECFRVPLFAFTTKSRNLKSSPDCSGYNVERSGTLLKAGDAYNQSPKFPLQKKAQKCNVITEICLAIAEQAIKGYLSRTTGEIADIVLRFSP